MPNSTPIPQSQVPLTDHNTDLTTTPWYRFLYDVFLLTSAGQNSTSLTDLQLAPSEGAVDAALAELVKVVQGVQVDSPVGALADTVAELTKVVQGIQSAPPVNEPTVFNAARALVYNSNFLLVGIDSSSSLPIDTVIYNHNITFDPLNYRLTVADTGNYLITIQVSLSKATPIEGESVWLELQVAGMAPILDYHAVEANASGAYACVLHGSLPVDMVSGDSVDIVIHTGTVGAGDWTIDASTANGLGLVSITRLS